MDHDAHARIDQFSEALHAISGRLDDLTRRLEIIERGVHGASAATVTTQAPVPARAETPRVSTPLPTPSPTPAATSSPAPIPGNSSDRLPTPSAKAAAFERVTRPAARVKPPRASAFDPSKFEWLLGIRGLMLLGVVVVIVGVGMFLKLAHDEGWIAALSPATKCGSAAVFGLLLIGLGEMLRKKLSPIASSGFTAAGIATLYASIYAASRIYGLIEVELAFGLLFVTTLSGIALGAIASRVMLSLLSLVGAFAVPLLLSTGEPSYFVLPCYLLLLLATGLVLSGWKGGRYAHARQLAWWGTGIIGTVWLVDMHERSLTSCLVFIGLAWTMTVLELSISARFFRSLRDRVEWHPACEAGFLRSAEGDLTFNPATLFSREARWVNALFGATIWAVISAGAVLRSQSPELMYLSPLAFAILSVCFVLGAMRLGNRPRASLTASSASPVSLFLSALVINASLLLVATIATGLGGWLEVMAWLSVGLAAIETGRRLRFRAVGLFGGAMLAFAIARLCSYDFAQYFEQTPMYTAFGLSITAWSVQMLSASIAAGLACWRSRFALERHIAGPVALWLIAGCLIHHESQLGSLGTAWAVLAAAACWATLRVAHPGLRLNLRTNALVLIAMGTLITVLAQFTDGHAHIDPVQLSVVLCAWIAISALPGLGFVLRSVGAFMAIAVAMLAIGRVQAEQGWAPVLMWDAVLLGTVIVLGRVLYRWSLSELGSLLLLPVACGWGLYQIDQGSAGLQQTPMIGADSIAMVLILGSMLYSGLTLRKRMLADDASEAMPETREQLRHVLLGGFWLLLLIASTIEVVRGLYASFDSGSAQGAGVSIWWSVYAVGSVALGFRLPKQLRWAGLALLCIVAGKVLLFDTMMLAPTARIIAAITTGLIIIATGVLYTMLVNRLERQDGEHNEGDADASDVTN